jgi:molybdopterin molybdotransferase
MLEAALAELDIETKAQRLKDDPALIKKALEAALKSELVLLSGGVSVGEADYSRDALKRLGVKTIFWGVAQKPGKPLYFGKRRSSLVFGLPGNPAAAWVCLHEYVRPALWAMQGLKEAGALRHAMSSSEPKPDQSKTLFMKAKLSGPKIELLGGQQSHMLKSLAEANALAVLPPKKTGRLLEVHPL